MKTAEMVAAMVSANKLDREGSAEWLADQFSRLEGIEGDNTLAQIAALRRAEILSVEETNALTLAHISEINGAGS